MSTASSKEVIYAALVDNTLIGGSANNEANQEIYEIAASFPGIEQTIVAIDQEIKVRDMLVKRVFIETESRRIFANKSGVVD